MNNIDPLEFNWVELNWIALHERNINKSKIDIHKVKFLSFFSLARSALIRNNVYSADLIVTNFIVT